jgi:hypothetical protein
MKRIGLMLLCLTMMGTPGLPAYAAPDDQPSAGEMTADLVVARPFGVAITAVGAAVFLVSLPFTALAGGVGHAADELVKKPAQETFMRCLGCRASGRYQAPR